MKTFLIILAVLSCSCHAPIVNARTAAYSTSGFSFQLPAGWKRAPNVIPIPTPEGSFGDMTFIHAKTTTFVFMSVIELSDLKEVLQGLNTEAAGAMKSNIAQSTEIKGAMEATILIKDDEFRVVCFNSGGFTNLIQSIITQPEGDRAVSQLLRAIKP